MDAAAVDPVADHDADGDPEERAAARERRVGRGVEGGEQEDGGLEALADDGEERHRRRARSTSRCTSASRRAVLEVAARGRARCGASTRS